MVPCATASASSKDNLPSCCIIAVNSRRKPRNADRSSSVSIRRVSGQRAAQAVAGARQSSYEAPYHHRYRQQTPFSRRAHLTTVNRPLRPFSQRRVIGVLAGG